MFNGLPEGILFRIRILSHDDIDHNEGREGSHDEEYFYQRIVQTHKIRCQVQVAETEEQGVQKLGFAGNTCFKSELGTLRLFL